MCVTARSSLVSDKSSMDRKEDESLNIDPRLLPLIDSTLDQPSGSDPRGYFTNPFSGQSKVGYLPLAHELALIALPHQQGRDNV